jgi:outer membrane immunogenic protein
MKHLVNHKLDSILPFESLGDAMLKITRMLAIAAAGLAPAFANAQSLPAPSGSYNWSGAYIGATVGYSAADMDAGDILFEGAAPPVDLDFGLSPDGVIGGATLGYNMQFGSFVAGLEGDISGTSLEESYSDATAGFTGTGELEWLATIRGRLGFAADRFLVYGTGGLAIGEIKATIDDDYGATVITTDDSQTHLGWTLGGGVEFALTDHITLKGEGLYYDLGSEDYSFNEGAGGWNPITTEIDANGWIGRAGINFRF